MSQTMRLNAPAGQRIEYVWPLHPERDTQLEEGKVYTVERVDVLSSMSYVKLVGIAGTYNTVMFREVEPILPHVETIKEVYERTLEERMII